MDRETAAEFLSRLPELGERANIGTAICNKAASFGTTPMEEATKALFELSQLQVPKKIPVSMLTWMPGHFINDTASYGPYKQAKIMIVAKAPNDFDIQSGSLYIPDQRSSNNYAIATLKSAGITDEMLSQTYITTACKFVPPKKNIAQAWIQDCKWLLAAELYLTRPEYLLIMGSEALKICFDNKASVERYRGDFKDIALNYGTLANPDTHTIKSFVMTNPSVVHRVPEQAPEILLDMTVFANRVNGVVRVSTTPVEHYVVETVEQLNSLEELIKDETVFAMDCEWSGSKPSMDNTRILTIQLSWGIGKAACIVVSSQDDGGPDNSCDNEAVREMLNRVLCRTDENGLPAVKVGGHNFRSDFAWLKSFGVDLTEQYHQGFDTMLGHHLLRETGNQGLEVCVLEYTDLGRYDVQLTDWLKQNLTEEVIKETGYAKVPREILYPYALLDADATYRVYLGVEEDLKKTPSLYNLYKDVVMKASIAITEMEANGLLVDTERMYKLGEIYAEKRNTLEEEFKLAINWPSFNFRSVQQVKEFLFGVALNGKKNPEDLTQNIKLSPEGALLLNLTPIKTTEKPTKMWADVVREGKQEEYAPSTDAESLGMLSSEHPLCDQLRKLKFVDQICKNFIPSEADVEEDGEKGLVKHLCPDNRIRTDIRQTLETGRWASRRPNLQNIPKKQESEMQKIFGEIDTIRSIFIPTPGWVLIEADYKQAELFAMSYLAKDQTMINILSDPNRDIHAETAIKMFDLPYRGFELDGNPKDWIEHNVEGGKAKRVAAKTLAFGIPYGRGSKAVAREIEKTGLTCAQQQAQSYIDSFLELYPQVCEFLQQAKDSVYDPGYLVNAYGRKRRFHYSPDPSVMAAQEREAGNFLIQSLVADTLSKASYNLWFERYDRMINNKYVPNYRMLLGIHDALLIECKPEDVDIMIGEVIPDCMCNKCIVPGINLKFEVDITVQSRWGEDFDEVELEALKNNSTRSN